MNWKKILIHLAGTAILFLAGILVFALAANLLILAGLTPQGNTGAGYGIGLANQTVYVAIGMIPVSIAGIFIRAKWRMALYLAPLYGPALFAIIYTLTQP